MEFIEKSVETYDTIDSLLNDRFNLINPVLLQVIILTIELFNYNYHPIKLTKKGFLYRDANLRKFHNKIQYL